MILVLHSVVRLLVLVALQVPLLFLVGLLTLGLVLEKVLRFRHGCCCLDLLVEEKIPSFSSEWYRHLSNCGPRDLAGFGVLVLNTHSWSGALQTLRLLFGWLGSDPVLDGFGEAASLLLSLWGEAGSTNRCPT